MSLLPEFPMMPIISFFSSILALLILIRNSELTVIKGVGISNLKTILPALILYFFIGIGKQRNYWELGEGIIRGFDTQIYLNDYLFKKSYIPS